MPSKGKVVAIPLLAISIVMWIYSVIGASSSGFFSDQLDLQWMVLGGAVSMVAGALAALWE